MSLHNVNVLINLPEETDSDIIEAIDNLKYLRFFLHPVNFKHYLLSVHVSSSSRYYSKVKEESDFWTTSSIAHEFLKEYINKTNQWDIFSFMKPTRHYLWDTFRRIEKFYLDNKHTYSIVKNNKTFNFREYVNGRKIIDFDMKETSLYTLILNHCNNKVITLSEIVSKIGLLKEKFTNEKIITTIDELYKKGLLYRSSDYSEIISVINLETT